MLVLPVLVLVAKQLNSHVRINYTNFSPSTSGNISSNELNLQHVPIPLSNYSSLVPSDQRELKYRDITFTRMGWFHPDREKSLTFARSQTLKHLSDAILQHERYNESAWDDLEQSPDDSRPIVAFLDVETCGEVNWPYFGGDLNISSDKSNGRAPLRFRSMLKVCDAVRKALDSPAMKASPHSRLVILNCAYPLSHQDKDEWFPECANGDRDSEIYEKLVIAHLSKHQETIHPTNDFGIAPLPARPVSLNATELKAIEDCSLESRPLLFSFQGRARVYFPEFKKYFDNLKGRDDIHVVFSNKHYEESNRTNSMGQKVLNPLRGKSQEKNSFYKLMRQTRFVGTPRGDKLFSYRFSEVLSAGAIPVVYADDYVLPYTRDVVHWDDNSLAIIIPQKKVNQTLDIIQNFTDRQICTMQQNALKFYNNYVKDSAGRLRGIIQVLDSRLKRFTETGTYGGVFSAISG